MSATTSGGGKRNSANRRQSNGHDRNKRKSRHLITGRTQVDGAPSIQDPIQLHSRAIANKLGLSSVLSSQLAEELAAALPSLPRGRLRGKVAAITGVGGNGGNGPSCAKLFHDEGACVAVIDKDGKCTDFMRSIDPRGQQSLAFIGDVTKVKEVSAFVAKCVERFGTIDVLVCNAGTARGHSFLSTTRRELHAQYDANFVSAWLCIKHVWPVMVAAGRGSIVTVGTVNSLAPALREDPYAFSKVALPLLCAMVVREADRQGVDIRANCVTGGFFPGNGPNSRARREADPDFDRKLGGLYVPGGKVLSPMNVARSVLFLATDESWGVSGHELVVDRGFTVLRYPSWLVESNLAEGLSFGLKLKELFELYTQRAPAK